MADDKVTYTPLQKKQMYTGGEYLCQVPPTCTARWNVYDWIAYIDKSGYWRPNAKRKRMGDIWDNLIEQANNLNWPEDYNNE